MLSELQKSGYFLGKKGASISLEEAITILEEAGHSLSRKDRVTSNNEIISSNVKYAVEGEFWFHSDACFVTIPPRYIIVEVIERDKGGALSILDCSRIDTDINQDFIFGNENHSISVPWKASYKGDVIYRYRKDYMKARTPENNSLLNELHSAVESSFKENAINLGELDRTEYLIVDNWKMLHSRADFSGERTINRYWFD